MYLFTTAENKKLKEQISKMDPVLQKEFLLLLQEKEKEFGKTIQDVIYGNPEIINDFMFIRGNRKRKILSEYENTVDEKGSVDEILSQIE
jgi:hypothetical protein